MICLVSFSKFSDMLPAFTCARAIGNLWRICLGDVLRLDLSKTLSEKHVPSIFIGSLPLSKASRTLSLQSKSAYKSLRIYFLFFLWILRFYFTLKI